MRTLGPRGFFVGWQANIVKDVPFAGLKLTFYEGLARVLYPQVYDNSGRDRVEGQADKRLLSPQQSAVVGFFSGVATAVSTGEFNSKTLAYVRLPIVW
jgi:hypothetical protein